MHFVTAWQKRKACGRLAFVWLAASSLAGPALLSAGPAAALSEIGREELPPPSAAPGEDPALPGILIPGDTVPPPDPLQQSSPDANDPEDLGGGQNAIARPEIDENGPLPEIVYNLDRLPEPVRRMHDLIVEAAKSGEIEKLRPLIGLGAATTQLSFGDIEGDPIDFLKGLSGDPEGREILAIMEEVLNAGFVHLEAGTPNEIYVWPYFFGIPLDKLDSRQKVELFKIVTAGDLEDMKQFGTYIFYRVGITPDGHWAFFVAGE
ncbi:hypothetical protein [Mesorhizobium sp. KR9-304]|uniref:hypothetical protein n=1 Tax=Mesorhizobium sp. KR9-304 TaxID=3156614 RepID=UPI0032B504E8